VAIKGLKAFALALRVEALIGFEILASTTSLVHRQLSAVKVLVNNSSRVRAGAPRTKAVYYASCNRPKKRSYLAAITIRPTYRLTGSCSHCCKSAKKQISRV